MARPKIINLIKNLFETAERGGWIKTYDKGLDYFCWSKPSLSKNTQEIKISKEVLLYLNKNGAIEGFGIEYLKNNFVEHNPRHKNITKLFDEKIEGEMFTISSEKDKEATEDFRMLVSDLGKDIFSENWGNEENPKDFDKLFSTALKN